MTTKNTFEERQLEQLKAKFPIGAEVKHAADRVEKKRIYWLQQGREPAKSNARRWWKEFAAERGTVLDVSISKAGHCGLKIDWGNGRISDCLGYMVERADK